MKKIILSTVAGAALAIAGSVSASDGLFQLGAGQMDSVSAGGYAYSEAGGKAGVKHTYYGTEVYSSAYGKGDKTRSFSAQLAACTGGCAIVASSGSEAYSSNKRKYGKKRKHKRKYGKRKYSRY